MTEEVSLELNIDELAFSLKDEESFEKYGVSEDLALQEANQG
jgi:hypothetical protein